jgi:hypothetical protein
MTTSFPYDDPNYQVRRYQGPFTLAAGTGNTSAGFAPPVDAVLHAAHFVVTTAGAGAANKRIVNANGTALGTTTLGTSTANTTATLDLAETTIAGGQRVTFTNGTDASGTQDAIIEWTPKALATFQN